MTVWARLVCGVLSLFLSLSLMVGAVSAPPPPRLLEIATTGLHDMARAGTPLELRLAGRAAGEAETHALGTLRPGSRSDTIVFRSALSKLAELRRRTVAAGERGIAEARALLAAEAVPLLDELAASIRGQPSRRPPHLGEMAASAAFLLIAIALLAGVQRNPAAEAPRSRDGPALEHDLHRAPEPAARLQPRAPAQSTEALAPYDPVTGLPTRARLAEHLSELRARSEAPLPPLALLHLDLDDFRGFNETHGRQTGDRALRHVAEILRSACGADDIAARSGADEFILLRVGSREAEEVMSFAESLQMLISAQAVLDGRSVRLGVSVGVAASPGDGMPDDLIAQAEHALAESTRLGRGRLSLYTRDLGDRLRRRRAMIDDLRAGLARDEIEPFFQPQIETATGRIAGMEALVRWRHPEQGVLAPWQFLELGAEARLTGAIGARMRETAFRQLARWKAEGLPVPRIGLNITAGELRLPDFVDTLVFDADAAGLAPADIAVELLESAMIERDDDPVVTALGRLSAAGFRVELDDFGTGHASISNLHRIRVDGIKIDRSFVTKLPERPEQQKLTRAMLSLAAALQIDTLAEGVETESERSLLDRMGCQRLQGFGIARPMPGPETTDWIRRHVASLPDRAPDRKRRA